HKGPSAEKLENLGAFLGEMGLTMPNGKDPAPKDYQTLLGQIEKRPDSHLIQTVLLRSLSQAKYEPENEGHFGLAYKAYTHFTSPIRRYPDLLVHRGIRSVIRSEQECKHVLRAEGTKNMAKRTIYPYDLQAMVNMGEHCSMAERRADDATRDVTDFLKCEYIRDKVGEDFEGVISAVTGFGLFVELKNVYVEGLVHVSTLQNDFYQFDAVKHRLIGERTRRSFRLGDNIWVKVVGVDLDDRKVDFELTTAPVNAGQNSGRSQPLDMPKPARLPRKRSASGKAGEKKGMTKEELMNPGRKKPGTAKGAGGTAAKADSKKNSKKKPSKRQKLNAKKNSSAPAKSTAKKNTRKKK
ncbi:RNB domain-containing ribonuclease, partial [Thalassolituus sp.]|uniref:RNB domain-containing ribonuclease n=1 Tax=Thalassolituus sp. TaxID=2030822 RepID=UPI0027D59B46